MTVALQFEALDVSVAEANRLVSTLEAAIRQAAPDAQLSRQSEGYTQDMGTILTVALAAPSVVALAKGIQIWLNRQHSVKVRVKRGDQTVELDNMTAHTALEALRHLTSK